MYPELFEYARATTMAEVFDLRAEHADKQVELLAGGHSLLPIMKSGLAAPDVIIDIGKVEGLRGIEQTDGGVKIGALTRYAEILDSDEVWEGTPLIAKTTAHVGDMQVRSRGTIGGNLAHADPAADLPAAVLAAEATIHAEAPGGQREIDADEFFHGIFTTALEEDELLTHIVVPHHSEGTGTAYCKKPNPASGYAVVGVAAVLHTDGEVVESARIAANGALDHAVRLPGVEAALEGVDIDDEDSLLAAAEHAADEFDVEELMDTEQTLREYRAQLLSLYTRRSIVDAAADVEVGSV